MDILIVEEPKERKKTMESRHSTGKKGNHLELIELEEKSVKSKPTAGEIELEEFQDHPEKVHEPPHPAEAVQVYLERDMAVLANSFEKPQTMADTLSQQFLDNQLNRFSFTNSCKLLPYNITELDVQ